MQRWFFLQVVCVSQEVDHEWHVVKTQNGICDFNCSLAMIFFKNNWGLDGFVWPSCRGHSFLMLLYCDCGGKLFRAWSIFLSVGPVIFCTCESHSS